jgi:hypothetical protein
MHKYLLVITIMLLLPIHVSYAEIYSWADSEGNRHATDDISKVPDAYRAQALANKMPDEETTGVTRKEQQEDRSGARYKAKPAKKGERNEEPTDKYGRGEAYWRSRAETLRQHLEYLRQDYESVSRQERMCEENHRIDYLGKRPDCTAMYRNQKKQLEQNIERAQKSLEVDLPDEVRKSEAYPGWIR